MNARDTHLTGNFDLHCHSTASDGLLGPADLVRRAAACGVTTLALTDHDELSGLQAAREAAREVGMRFVNGVEISVSWEGRTIHIVGLRIDPENETLVSGLETVRNSRAVRAERMADALAAAGIPGSLEGAYAFAENPRLIGRTHFARFLVASGRVRDVKSVFQRFLVAGKPGYAPHQWASLEAAVGWITTSGGRAIVAHPGRYRLERAEMREFLAEFKSAGGEGVEVVTGSHTRTQYAEYALLAQDLGLLASRGSDFHGPQESAIELGGLPPLPAHLQPVWHDWS
ncbi:MAG: PHP domain-containing protein [Gammaproteobacteria bacterium]|nr:PHP domain-containing protein [Gammaproteobacteria bacterium]